jgi:hypothetical protein
MSRTSMPLDPFDIVAITHWTTPTDRITPSQLPDYYTYAVVDHDGYVLNLTWSTGDRRRAIYRIHHHAKRCATEHNARLIEIDVDEHR